MNEKTLYKLEFHKIREILKAFALTDGGKRKVDTVLPLADIESVRILQNETKEAINMSIKKGRIPIANLKEIKPILKRVEIGAVLNSGEILQVRDILRTSRQVKSYQKEDQHKEYVYEHLDGYFESLSIYSALEREIDRCIIAPEQFADAATDQLFHIRKQMRSINGKIKETLQGIIHANKYQDMLQEAVITMRRDRYCVPIKIEYKNQFKGIVHDQSSTGATVFIEPMAVVDLGNELKSLETKEAAEIEKILIDLTSQIAGITSALAINYDNLIKLDLIFARSEFSLKYDCREPRLNNEGYVQLKRARHPLLSKDTVVPIDVHIGKAFTTLLITGPNTGGKTVALKTIGLFTLMAEIGLQIPAAEGSEIAVFDGIYADLGDEQSIEQSLSTFSAHMTNIVSILEQMTTNSLVLMDEVGSGTDPIEGAALAMAILEHLRKQQIRTVATTHYSELKLYALSTDGVENASFEFDLESLQPTYRLLIGVPGKSNAFAISMKLGLAEYLIEDAKVFLHKENVKMEDILLDLEQSKKTAEIESLRAKEFRAEAEKLREEIKNERQKIEKTRKKILERTELKAKEILKQAEAETDKVLKEVRSAARKAQVMIDEKELQQVKSNMHQVTKQQDQQVNKSLGFKSAAAKKLKTVSVGQEVMVTSLMQKGIVIEPLDSSGHVIVRLGILPMKVHLSNLQKLEEETHQEKKVNKPKSSKGSVSYNVSKTSTISPEIDIRGMLVDEGIQVVDKYLDDAYLSGLKQVTIIHGKGTGALRAGITNMLKRHPHIEAHRPGKYGEGEMGVTVVTIK
ncbi:endonuclease MutS2 [Cellulosilyticum sp. I15G10I2]|uniref:endonuclease MutS2 n=1 Tax=Cellulosilyticum sp. I15G10I2 TaxID=1892843 RepID=UPI00085C0C36|nr:endonuclease MutS2 [Cellulosilyticum sp. I15G10I2]